MDTQKVAQSFCSGSASAKGRGLVLSGRYPQVTVKTTLQESNNPADGKGKESEEGE